MVLVAVPIVLVVLVHLSGLPWRFAIGVTVLIPVASYVIALLIARKLSRENTIYAFGRVKELLKWDDCPRCTAGTQWWNGERWGPIPEHARRVVPGTQYFEAAQVNIRKCLYCGTKGGWWTPRMPKKEVVLFEVEEESDEA